MSESKNFLNRFFKKTDEDYEDDYELQGDEYDDDEDIIPIPKYQSSSNRVMSLGQPTGMGQTSTVCVYEPVSVDKDGRSIVDSLKANKICVLNLQKVENVEEARAIFNFLKGAMYAIEGTMKTIAKGIFLLTPSNIDVDGTIEKEIELKNLYQWDK